MSNVKRLRKLDFSIVRPSPDITGVYTTRKSSTLTVFEKNGKPADLDALPPLRRIIEDLIGVNEDVAVSDVVIFHNAAEFYDVKMVEHTYWELTLDGWLPWDDSRDLDRVDDSSHRLVDHEQQF